MMEMRLLMGKILTDHDPCMSGLSRALKSPSERVIRVLATLMLNLETSWVRQGDRERLFVNMMYLLSDEDGELHPPKDSNRNEIALTAEEQRSYRVAILEDLFAMSQSERPLSPAYWR